MPSQCQLYVHVWIIARVFTHAITQCLLSYDLQKTGINLFDTFSRPTALPPQHFLELGFFCIAYRISELGAPLCGWNAVVQQTLLRQKKSNRYFGYVNSVQEIADNQKCVCVLFTHDYTYSVTNKLVRNILDWIDGI
jgi:hypothetical protein